MSRQLIQLHLLLAMSLIMRTSKDDGPQSRRLIPKMNNNPGRLNCKKGKGQSAAVSCAKTEMPK